MTCSTDDIPNIKLELINRLYQKRCNQTVFYDGCNWQFHQCSKASSNQSLKLWK